MSVHQLFCKLRGWEGMGGGGGGRITKICNEQSNLKIINKKLGVSKQHLTISIQARVFYKQKLATVVYQQIENSERTNQIHRFTTDDCEFILKCTNTVTIYKQALPERQCTSHKLLHCIGGGLF